MVITCLRTDHVLFKTSLLKCNYAASYSCINDHKNCYIPRMIWHVNQYFTQFANNSKSCHICFLSNGRRACGVGAPRSITKYRKRQQNETVPAGGGVTLQIPEYWISIVLQNTFILWCKLKHRNRRSVYEGLWPHSKNTSDKTSPVKETVYM